VAWAEAEPANDREAFVNADYNPRSYWDNVAARIALRGQGNVVAGDDTPFTRYVRNSFVEEFGLIDFGGQRVLEVGPGPGGNLALVAGRHPTWLIGCDISEHMIELARKNLRDLQPAVELFHINGRNLPLQKNTVDITYTVTVLQHVCDEDMLADLLIEICRVTTKRIILFEDTFYRRWEKYSHVGRPVANYERLLSPSGFTLVEVKHLSTAYSHIACSTIRRATSPHYRHEAEPIPVWTARLQRACLALTRRVDRLWPLHVGLTKMMFER